MLKVYLPTVNFDPEVVALLMEVYDTLPHFPIVPDDLAADGLFSQSKLSN